MEENQIITITPENSTFSGHELVIIPSDPKFSPTDIQIAECLHFLKEKYPKNSIESVKSKNAAFIDSGQNLETISCNLCGKEMETEFWQEQMSNSFNNSNFNDLDFVTDCCKKKTNLNDLHYNGACGFSSYSLSINNAEPDEDLETLIAKTIGEILGTGVKVFWRHI